MSADLMEFPQSQSRNKYLIMLTDLFTRWIEVNRVSVQKTLEDLVVFRLVTPRRPIAQNESEFDNEYIAKVLKCYGIELFATPLYHHRADR